MQYDEQVMRYGADPCQKENERVAYLNPIKICEDRHNFRIGEDAKELKGLEGQEREDMKKKVEEKV